MIDAISKFMNSICGGEGHGLINPQAYSPWWYVVVAATLYLSLYWPVTYAIRWFKKRKGK